MEMHDKYIITDIFPVGRIQTAMGVHSEKRQFATWEVKDGEYLWAHYFTDQQEAIKDLCSRTLREMNNRQKGIMREDNDYTVTAIVKNGKDTAVIEFPTNELADILGSIGIREPVDKVCIGGKYAVEITPGSGKMADALNHIFKKGDSLHLVNETARSVYHADYFVYDMVEEKLKYGEFSSAEELKKAADTMAEKLKKKNKKSAR